MFRYSRGVAFTMVMSESPFEPGINDLLSYHYGQDVADEVTENVRYAQLPFSGQQAVPYIRVGQHTSDHPEMAPIVIGNGFSTNLVSRLAYLAQFAAFRIDAIMVGQNRMSIPVGYQKRHKDAATMMLAESQLAVLAKEELEHNVDYDVHSYGSLVFQGMTRLCSDGFFSRSNVILRSPAGMIHNESWHRVVSGTVRSMVQERLSRRDIPELQPYAIRSTNKTVFENLLRSRSEIFEIPSSRLDYHSIISRVANLTLMTTGNDKLYPEQLQLEAIQDAVAHGATWLSPTRIDRPDGTMRKHGNDDATHNSESGSPLRVASSVIDTFQRARGVRSALTAADTIG